MGVAGADHVRDDGAIRLLFRVATDGWFVEFEGRWYEPATPTDVDSLLAILPLELIDERELSSERPRGGYVRVAGDIGADSLEFITAVGDHVRRLVHRVSDTSSLIAEWRGGNHEDGWVETHATLYLSGMRRCWIDAYLPPSFEGDKELAVKLPVGRRTTVDIHKLVRGRPMRIALYDGPPAAGITVTLQTSAPEPADDERPLGFLASGLEVQR